MSWVLSSVAGWSRHGSSASIPNKSLSQDSKAVDLDVPPLFPLPGSAQRSSGPPPPVPNRQQRPVPPSFSIAPPSPALSPDSGHSDLHIAILPDPVPLGDMAPPHSTIKKPAFGLQPGGDDMSSEPTKKLDRKKARGKVALGPGFSALDWNRLANSGRNLRGTDEFPKRVTVDELLKHNSKKDAWSVFNGKVYNITPYLPFHPGGEAELMRVAGRDGTKLFMLTHSWVNMEYMLQECMVGVLVRG